MGINKSGYWLKLTRNFTPLRPARWEKKAARDPRAGKSDRSARLGQVNVSLVRFLELMFFFLFSLGFYLCTVVFGSEQWSLTGGHEEQRTSCLYSFCFQKRLVGNAERFFPLFFWVACYICIVWVKIFFSLFWLHCVFSIFVWVYLYDRLWTTPAQCRTRLNVFDGCSISKSEGT